MGSGKEELRIGGDGEGDVVGEVLRDIEGDKAIDADGFVGVWAWGRSMLWSAMA